MRDGTMIERIGDTGGIVIAEGPQEMAARMVREFAENREMARVAGVTAS